LDALNFRAAAKDRHVIVPSVYVLGVVAAAIAGLMLPHIVAMLYAKGHAKYHLPLVKQDVLLRVLARSLVRLLVKAQRQVAVNCVGRRFFVLSGRASSNDRHMPWAELEPNKLLSPW